MRAGVGSCTFTPGLPVTLAGFGARTGRVDRVHDDLEVSALVLREATSTLCLLVLDVLLLGPAESRAVRRAVAAELGITEACVLPCATHTHSAPSPSATTRLLRWPVPAGFTNSIVRACVLAARQALAALRDTELAHARGPLPVGLSVNRRQLPYDPTLAVLDLAGVATVTNVGVHPVALGVDCRSVATDWIGPFRRAMAEATGRASILLPGALGDVNPVRDPHTDPDPGGSFATAEALGADVSTAALALLPLTVPLGESITTWHRTVRPRAAMTLPAVLQRVMGRRVPVELIEWDLGGLRLVSVPGEAFHALGRAIEDARPEHPVLVAGLSPCWQGYLPVPFTTGYEEKMSLGRGFVAQVAAALTRPP
jgi:hypothetical protein